MTSLATCLATSDSVISLIRAVLAPGSITSLLSDAAATGAKRLSISTSPAASWYLSQSMSRAAIWGVWLESMCRRLDIPMASSIRFTPMSIFASTITGSDAMPERQSPHCTLKAGKPSFLRRKWARPSKYAFDAA